MKMYKVNLVLYLLFAVFLGALSKNLDYTSADYDEDDDDSVREVFGEHQWVGIIEYKSNEGQINQGCVATLITPRHAVTAAHCLSGPKLERLGQPTSIIFGEHDRSKNADCDTFSDYVKCSDDPIHTLISRITLHEDYKTDEVVQRNDIAVAHLAADVPKTEYIKPIAIAKKDFTANWDVDDGFYVAGWGTVPSGYNNSVKMEAETPHVDRETCQIYFDDNMPSIELWEGQICAGNRENSSFCFEDSGGALIYMDGEKPYLVGVSSFGVFPCTAVAPTVYTKVYHYRKWIEEEILSLE